MLSVYSLIVTGFLILLVVIPLVSTGTRNELYSAAVKSAVLNGLVVVALVLQYAHLIYVSTIAPHHSAWTFDNTYVRYDCYESEKGGKLPNDFRDCLLGQSDACTIEEPCTPCPVGGDHNFLSTDHHMYLQNYTGFFCRNCTDPYRAFYDCQYSDQFGPYCLVDPDAAPVYDGGECLGQGVEQLVQSNVLQLPLVLQQHLNSTAQFEPSNISYDLPTVSTVACGRCCTKMWDEELFTPGEPTVDPPGGEFTRYVSVDIIGEGIYYTLDGQDPDPCASNGFWFLEPVEISDIGTTIIKTIATFRGKYSEVVTFTFEITDCSAEWFLEMSSMYVERRNHHLAVNRSIAVLSLTFGHCCVVICIFRYPTGGVGNTKDALIDEYPTLTGAGTGNYRNSDEGNWIAARFSAVVFIDQVG